MSRIESYRPEDIEPVREFNRRLREGGVEFQFPEEVISSHPQQKFYLCKEEDTVVGGYILKSEPIHIRGVGEQIVGNYQLPLSLGAFDARYGMAGIEMLFDALKANPLLYCLGMGGTDRPLPRMLRAMGWSIEEVPFYFQVIHARRFVANIEFLKGRKGLRFILGVLSGFGIATGLNAIYLWLHRPKVAKDLKVVEVPGFTSGVQELWSRVCESSSYQGLLSRSLAALDIRFEQSDARFIRLECYRDSHLVGWALLTCSQLKNHKQFGNMILGTWVDGLSDPGLESSLIAASRRVLTERGADLLVSNQTYSTWGEALRKNGFLCGPSNFALARSPGLTELLGESRNCHWNRGDGDGPKHL